MNDVELIPTLSYNATKYPELKLYVVFPGKKLFVSIYHPFRTFATNIFNEPVFYKITVKATLISVLPGIKDKNCIQVDENFSSISKAHEDYEHWYK